MTQSRFLRVVAAVVGAVAFTAAASASASAGEVNLYSSRQPFLIAPLLAAFTKETGIKVNMVYLKKGMLQRLKAEGINSPADAILTSDIGNLHNHAKAGLLQPVRSRVLETNIPAQYRHAKNVIASLLSPPLIHRIWREVNEDDSQYGSR